MRGPARADSALLRVRVQPRVSKGCSLQTLEARIKAGLL